MFCFTTFGFHFDKITSARSSTVVDSSVGQAHISLRWSDCLVKTNCHDQKTTHSFINCKYFSNITAVLDWLVPFCRFVMKLGKRDLPARQLTASIYSHEGKADVEGFTV